MATLHKWEGAKVPNVALSEKRLLAVLSAMGKRTVQGSEYFQGIPFTFAQFQAANLSLSVVEHCCCGACVLPTTISSHVRVCQAPVNIGVGCVELGLLLPCGEVIQAAFSTYDVGELEPSAADLRPGDELIVEVDPLGHEEGGAWNSYIHTFPSRLPDPLRGPDHGCSLCDRAASMPHEVKPRPRRSVLGGASTGGA